MSALRSALEEWIGEDVAQVDLEQLADDLQEIETVSGILEAERLRRIASFDARSGAAHFYYPSLTAWLKDRCKTASGRAHRLVARARSLAAAGGTFSLLQSGRLSSDQAGALMDQAAALPEKFAQAEEHLLEAVSELGVTDTRRALEYWRQSVDGPGTITAEMKELEMRGVSASRSMGGLVRLDGWLTPPAGEALMTALDALMPPPSKDDSRTPRQRRHDALEDLARDFLEHGDTPIVGGERPHINLVCDLPALQGIAGGLHESENGDVLTIASLQAVACDSSLSRIVIGPNSEIIDVGRRTRVIPTAIRRAVITRDRHCVWPGCDRNPRWCDVHHRKHWALLGETNTENGELLCRFHHVLTHLLE